MKIVPAGPFWIDVPHRFEWSDALSVGLTEIDHDHRRLYGLYRELASLMKSSRGGEMLQQALTELVEYTQIHFAREETWMCEQHYPGTVAHVCEHRTLTNQVLSLHQSQASDNTTIVAVGTLRLLGAWIPGHILDTDRRMSAYLQKVGFGRVA